jgi:hypothetical protein
MFDWLLKKTQNARFSNQITQTLWLVEGLDLMDRAHGLLWVGLLGNEMTDETGVFRAAFHNPSKYPRAELLKLYYPLEENRIKYQLHTEQTLKDGLFAQVMGEEAKKHMLAGLHAWQIILATLAPGLAHDSGEKVRRMWQCLQESHGQLVPAMGRFKRCVGGVGGTSFPFSDSECIERARLIPDQFTSRNLG